MDAKEWGFLKSRAREGARLARAVACAWTLSLASMVLAEAPPAPQASSAESEYEAGKAALKADDKAAALGHFKAALALAEGDERTTWQMLLAVAVTYQRMDEPAFAIEYYKRFLKRSDDYRDALTGKWSKRRANAAEDIEALETKTKATHGFVTVVSEPRGASVFLGDTQAGADRDATTTFGGYVKAGSYRVTLRLEGYEEVTRTIAVEEGKLFALKETLKPLPSALESPASREAGGAAIATAPVVSKGVEIGDELELGPWIVMGSGGALAITGVVLGVMAASSRGEWTDFVESYEPSGQGELIAEQSARYEELESQTKGYELGAAISAAVALAAIGGGVVWWLLDQPSEAEAQSALPTLRIAPTLKGAYGAASWSF